MKFFKMPCHLCNCTVCVRGRRIMGIAEKLETADKEFLMQLEEHIVKPRQNLNISLTTVKALEDA